MKRAEAQATIVVAIVGISGLLGYLVTSLGGGGDPFSRLQIVGLLLMGPAALAGTWTFVAALRRQRDTLALAMSQLLLAASFALMTVMVILQGMAAAEAHAATLATDPNAALVLRASRRALTVTQLGLDVAFDIFYCGGLLALGGSLFRTPGYGKTLGTAGVASGGLLLALTLIAFPQPPSQAGWPDLGPLTGAWWIAVIGARIRARRNSLGISVGGS